MNRVPESRSECRALVLSTTSRALAVPPSEVPGFEHRASPSWTLVLAVWSTRAVLAAGAVAALAWSFPELLASKSPEQSVSVSNRLEAVQSSLPRTHDGWQTHTRYASLQFGGGWPSSESEGFPSSAPAETEPLARRAERLPRTKFEPRHVSRQDTERSPGLLSLPRDIDAARQPSAVASVNTLPIVTQAKPETIAYPLPQPAPLIAAGVVLPVQKPARFGSNKPAQVSGVKRRHARPAPALSNGRRAASAPRRRGGSSIEHDVRAFKRNVHRSLRRTGRAIHRGISQLF